MLSCPPAETGKLLIPILISVSVLKEPTGTVLLALFARTDKYGITRLVRALKTVFGMITVAFPATVVKYGTTTPNLVHVPQVKTGTDSLASPVRVVAPGIMPLTPVLVPLDSTGTESTASLAASDKIGTDSAASLAPMDKYGTQPTACASVLQANNGTALLA